MKKDKREQRQKHRWGIKTVFIEQERYDLFGCTGELVV